MKTQNVRSNLREFKRNRLCWVYTTKTTNEYRN